MVASVGGAVGVVVAVGIALFVVAHRRRRVLAVQALPAMFEARSHAHRHRPSRRRPRHEVVQIDAGVVLDAGEEDHDDIMMEPIGSVHT